MAEPEAQDSGGSLLRSSALLVLIRFVQRSLGLISLLVLARLLTPDDFGIVAITAFVIGLVEILSKTGIRLYIAQKDTLEEGDVDTAWTLEVLSKTALFCLLFALSPLVSAFYDDERLTLALRVVSAVVVLRALFNPALHVLRRELRYERIFWLQSGQKFLSFVTVIAIALTAPSYWAMIVGDLVAAGAGLVGSYFLHPYRPRFSLVRFSQQWNFTKWMLMKGVVGYLRSQIDTVLVPRMLGIPALGRFEVVRSIAVLPSNDVITPATEPLVSTFSRSRHDPVALQRQLRASLVMILTFLTPVCVVFAALADPLVDLLLGARWEGSGPLLVAFIPLLISFAFGGVLHNILIALDRVRLLFFYDLLSLLAILAALLLAAPQSLEAFAWVRGATGLATVLAGLIVVFVLTRVGPLAVLRMLWPCLLAGGLCVFVAGLLPTVAGLLEIAFASSVLGLCFLLTIFACYRLVLHRFDDWQELGALVLRLTSYARARLGR